ncbi:hypothetical protein HDZ31DRAFT_42663 [Schizophyllum fasciatum]
MSSIETSPRKRQRTDSPSDETLSCTASPERHEKHWYDDGSVVLQVEDVLFRVHRSILAKYSPIFKDAFAMPQPAGEEEVDGCLVVHLRGDCRRGWSELLDAIYDAFTYFDGVESLDLEEKFSTATALLRVSTKYRVRYCRERCLSILSRHFASSPQYTPVAVLPTVAQACEMVRLAREAEAMMLLPFALMRIASEDHSTIYAADIPLVDKLAVFDGRLELIAVQRERMFPFVKQFKSPQTCERFRSGYNPCSSSIEQQFSKYLATPERLFYFVDDPTYWFTRECVSCKVAWCKIIMDGRQHIWDRLPEIFHLGKSWAELRQAQEVDNSWYV